MTPDSFVAIGIFVGILGFLAYFLVKKGNFSFWSIAHKLPEEFLSFALANNDVWVVSDSSVEGIGQAYTGPFKFVVNGKVLTLYALADEIENSQATFVQQFSGLIPQKGFPFVSMLALMYPIVAMATYPGGEVGSVLGYGFSNLGYLLVAALIPGSFRIFGMEHRFQILVGAAIFWVAGVILVNL